MRNDKLTELVTNCSGLQTSLLASALKALVMGRNAGLLAAVSLLFTLTGCADLSVPEPDQVSQAAVNHAHAFLGSEQHGKQILGFVHFGATYHGHEYLKTVKLGSGNFALVYRFNWEDDGTTDIAFHCDSEGKIQGVEIESSNAQWTPPFVLANVAIAVVGNTLLSTFRDDMSEADVRQVRELINQADAKSLLEWSIRFQQRS